MKRSNTFTRNKSKSKIQKPNQEQEEDSLLLTLFDTNLIQNIFTKLFKTYKYQLQRELSRKKIKCNLGNQLILPRNHHIKDKDYEKYFFKMNNFKIVCSLFNNISKQTLFNLNIYNIKFKIPYNLYFKLSYIQTLVERCYAEKNIDSMFLHTCKNGFYDIISTLIEQGKANMNAIPLLYSSNALLEAVKYHKIETIKELFKYKELDINLKTNSTENTPLMEACKNNFKDIVELFLSRNDLELNIRNHSGFTVLIFAILYNRENIVSLLLSQKNKININLKDNDQKTALDHAKRRNYQNIIKIIQNYEKKLKNS